MRYLAALWLMLGSAHAGRVHPAPPDFRQTWVLLSLDQGLAPIQFFESAEGKTPAFELNSEGLFQQGKKICGWEHPATHPRLDSRWFLKGCPAGFPLVPFPEMFENCWALMIPITARQDKTIQTLYQGKSYSVDLATLPRYAWVIQANGKADGQFEQRAAQALKDQVDTGKLAADKTFGTFLDQLKNCLSLSSRTTCMAALIPDYATCPGAFPTARLQDCLGAKPQVSRAKPVLVGKRYLCWFDQDEKGWQLTHLVGKSIWLQNKPGKSGTFALDELRPDGLPEDPLLVRARRATKNLSMRECREN